MSARPPLSGGERQAASGSTPTSASSRGSRSRWNAHAPLASLRNAGYPRHIAVGLRSIILLLVAAAAVVGTVAIQDSCREGTAWEAITVALLTGGGSAVALAAFLPLRQRKITALGIALLVGASYGAAWLVAIEETGVGDHCFH